ncbi:transmembrane protein 179B [Dromiciops gliroides]|uniref:transmembrane protein 179B n=1 Tax=Dromiciops gliroides TaxID=33562 RepID=UPI001CC7CAE6|nr:transmembrane protein 179B [Dromiciops gliroides]
MALPRLHSAELVLFAAAFLAGAVVAAAVFRTQGTFNGQCPVYGTTSWNHSALSLSSSSAPSLCYFVAGVSGLLALYGLLVVFYWTYSSCLEDSHRSPLGLRVSLGLSAAAAFLVLVSSCILRFGTKSLCASIMHLKIVDCCSDAQKLRWEPPRPGLHFYSTLYTAEASSWVSLVFWCLLLALQLLQWKREAPPYRPLERGDPEWSSETDALFGARPSRP